MIRKLILIRIKYIKPEGFEELAPELVPFIKGDPVPVTPEAWADAAGLSHYAYTLEGLRLKDAEKVREWAAQNLDATVLDLDDGKGKIDPAKQIENALHYVGLRVNKAA